MRNRLHLFAYYSLLVVEFAAVVLLGGVAAQKEIATAGRPTPIWDILLIWVPTVPVGVIVGATIAVPIVDRLRAWIGPPWVRPAIQNVLTRFGDTAFAGVGGPPYDHRITLFRYRQVAFMLRRRRGSDGKRPWRLRACLQLPWSGWLFPYSRSGLLGQRSKTRFWASAHAPDEAEGVVGQTWAQRKVIRQTGLPDPSLGAEEIAKYAQESFVGEAMVEERLKEKMMIPRSLIGVPVEVKGRPWGVIVFDSPDPEGIPDDRQNIVLKNLVAALHPLLARSR